MENLKNKILVLIQLLNSKKVINYNKQTIQEILYLYSLAPGNEEVREFFDFRMTPYGIVSYPIRDTIDNLIYANQIGVRLKLNKKKTSASPYKFYFKAKHIKKYVEELIIEHNSFWSLIEEYPIESLYDLHLTKRLLSESVSVLFITKEINSFILPDVEKRINDYGLSFKYSTQKLLNIANNLDRMYPYGEY